MEQQWEITLGLVRGSLPIIPGHKKELRLPISEGRRLVLDDPSPPLPRHQLIVPVLLRFLQTIQVDELIHSNHISIRSSQPYPYTADHYPPRIGHKLSRSNTKTTQKLHNIWVNREPKSTLEGSFVEAYLPKEEMASLLLLVG